MTAAGYTPDPADEALVMDALDAIPDCATAHGWPLDGPCPICVTAAVLSALAAGGRLLPPDATVMIECEIDWVDVRGAGHDAYGLSYAWKPAVFDTYLAREIAAAERLHREPVKIRKRTVSTWPDGSTLVGPWLPAPTTEDAP